LEVLHCHGGSDGMAAPETGRAGADCLRRAGCRVHFSLYGDVGHTISTSMVVEARTWLEKRLGDGEDPALGGKEEAKLTSPASPKDNAQDATVASENSAQVFDIGADEDEEADNNGDDWGDDLDAVFGFGTPSKEKKAEEESQSERRDAAVFDGDDDLDAMYDFTAVNSAALASDAKPPAEPRSDNEDSAVAESAASGAEPHREELPRDTAMREEGPQTDENVVKDGEMEVAPRTLSEAAVPLAAAARRGDVEEVKALLRQRANPNERDAAGETPLFSAARGSYTDVVAVLLLGKADPSLRSENGLVAADLLPGPPVGALLWLALGAEVSAREQREAFEALEECTRFLVARLLEKHCAKLAVRDVLSDTEWVAACARPAQL